MSGTSLDGIDGVVLRSTPTVQVLRHSFRPFPPALRDELLALNTPGPNELHRAALAGNSLARNYALVVHDLLQAAGIGPEQIVAIGAHGQTVRHRPLEFDADPAQAQAAVGYTLQLNNPALLAELTGIDVVAEFRTRDLAAGGQGAPLVPAFHQEVFGNAMHSVAVVNVGGISNMSVLPRMGPGSPPILGFDCGPGNALMDHWVHLHKAQNFDAQGAWAALGQVQPALLESFMAEPFLHRTPPKSTGRDLFNPTWLQACLATQGKLKLEDVQASLCEFTALAIARDLQKLAPDARQLWVCGGGALNLQLMRRLSALLPSVEVAATDALGIPPLQVEAAAFAWLAAKAVKRQTGSLQSVTGARGARVLGAIYPRYSLENTSG